MNSAQKFLLACLSRTSCSASRAFKNILRTSANILRIRMDTTTDTSLDPQGAGSLPRELCFELLEPVFNDDQLVGRAGLQWPNHQEAPVVWGHGVLRVKSEGCESRGRKEYRSAAERECRTGI